MQERQEHLLRTAIDRDYGVQVELSTELDSFEEHDDHVVAHIVKKSPNGEQKEELISVQFLVGADGGKSSIRKRLGIQFVGDSSDAHSIGMVAGDIVALEGTLDQKVGLYLILRGHGADYRKQIWRLWGSPRNKLYISSSNLSEFIFTSLTRLSLRPCSIPGKNHLNFFIGGKNIDLEKVVSSRDEVLSTIHDITGRDDLKFGEVVVMNIWRCASFVL